jgi:hypothetical protein
MIQIHEAARTLARRKWLGIVGDSEAPSTASDAEFVSCFGSKTVAISGKLIARFAASNNDETRRTGGYSIMRRFMGGADTRAPAIEAFMRGRATEAGRQWAETPDEANQIIPKLVAELAATYKVGSPGYTLGISAASKLLFFSCPEMPVFIYDSLVQKFLGCPAANSEYSYAVFWQRCSKALNSPGHIETGLPPEHGIYSLMPPMDWFKRRCLDLEFYLEQQAKTTSVLSFKAEAPIPAEQQKVAVLLDEVGKPQLRSCRSTRLV